EVLEHVELVLLFLGLLLAARGAVGLDRLQPPLALALQHLQLLVLVERPLDLLLGRAQRVQDQPQGVAAVAVALLHRVLQLRLEARNEAHVRSQRRPSRRLRSWLSSVEPTLMPATPAGGRRARASADGTPSAPRPR